MTVAEFQEIRKEKGLDFFGDLKKLLAIKYNMML